MINVDIIIPVFFKKKRYQQNPILLYKWKPDWLRVRNNLSIIEEKGVKVRFYNYLNIKYNKLSPIVIIDYRILPNLITYNPSAGSTTHLIISFLKKLRKHVEYLIFFDNKDSTDIQYQFLPYVDRYVKKQFYKDRSLYLNKFYGYRNYTDYYVKNYNLDKKNFFEPVYYIDNIINKNLNDEKECKKNRELYKQNEKKLYLSWNLAFADYRIRTLMKNPYSLYFSKKFKLLYYKPSLNRKLLLSANFKINFEAESISFQRKKILKFLIQRYKSYPNVSLGGIPKRTYLKVLSSSKIIISPFGWGEVCYRDFESFIAGSTLIKPNMDHLETWPDIYKKNQTYIPISWKPEDWQKEFDLILSDEKNLLEIAKIGQEEYKKFWTKEANEEFCDRFIKLISPN